MSRQGQQFDAYGRPISKHDDVPTSGAWQTDPVVQGKLGELRAAGGNRKSIRLQGNNRADWAQSSGDPLHRSYRDFQNYIDANRGTLGIPDNYYPAIENGQLWDPNQNFFRNASLTTAGVVGAGLAAPYLTGLGGGGGGAGAVAQAPAGAGAGAAGAGAGAGGAAAMGTLDKIMKYLSNPFIASIAGGAINGIFGGEDPTGQRNPFTGQVDPQKMLEQSKGLITGSMSDAVRKSEKPAKLRSSYVQQPISYSGGGLPFTIGLSGSDPALADPSLLEGQPGDHTDLKMALKAMGINI